jgi:hypothetical protein
MPRFSSERQGQTIRFESLEGWITLELHLDCRASIACGLLNGTEPEKFGDQLWHLLHDVMPEFGLEVVQAEFVARPETERIYLGAGFHRDGRLRSWSKGRLRDLDVYSILSSEVKYEIRPPHGPDEMTGTVH